MKTKSTIILALSACVQITLGADPAALRAIKIPSGSLTKAVPRASAPAIPRSAPKFNVPINGGVRTTGKLPALNTGSSKYRPEISMPSRLVAPRPAGPNGLGDIRKNPAFGPGLQDVRDMGKLPQFRPNAGGGDADRFGGLFQGKPSDSGRPVDPRSVGEYTPRDIKAPDHLSRGKSVGLPRGGVRPGTQQSGGDSDGSTRVGPSSSRDSDGVTHSHNPRSETSGSTHHYSPDGKYIGRSDYELDASPAGGHTTTHYDSDGRQTSTVRVDPAGAGDQKTVTYPDGIAVTTRTDDPDAGKPGALTCGRDPEGSSNGRPAGRTVAQASGLMSIDLVRMLSGNEQGGGGGGGTSTFLSGRVRSNTGCPRGPEESGSRTGRGNIGVDHDDLIVLPGPGYEPERP